jgi:hypothetical protein
MILYPKTLKLYHFWNKNGVSLSIKSSDFHVLSFYMESDIFQRMIKDCYSDEGYSDDLHFIQVKENYTRFSKQGAGFTTHMRIDKGKWGALIEEYSQKIKKPQGEYFSCEID